MKNKRLIYGTFCILLFAFCILLSSCKEDAEKVHVSGVSLDRDSLWLTPDSIVQLTATVTPGNADFQGVTWLSTNETVATVSPTGLVSGIAEGTTSIVVTTVEGGFTDTCTVTIDHVVVPVSSVSLDRDSLGFTSGSTVQLTVTVMPENADFQEVTWHSTDEAVATVSPTGLVAGKAKGVASIIVTSNDGGFADTCAVTVEYRLIADLNPPAAPQLLDPTPPDGEYWEHGSFFKLWEHTEGYGHGVKIAIVGESFTREENRNNGVYETWCKKMASRLLRNDIVRNFRNYIDIYVAVAESPVSRINATTPGFFGTTVSAWTNFDAANAFIATSIPELSGVLNRSYILIANGMMGGYANFGQPAGNAGSAWWSTDMGAESRDDVSTYWMMHEFMGHGFASLADEYPGASHTYEWIWQRSGMVCNVSNTNNLANVLWKRFIGLEGYEEVGAYQIEGESIWIPEAHSIMVGDELGFYYNAQSRWLIYKHIYDCSKFLDNQTGTATAKPKKYETGEEAALFDAFLEFDKLYNVR